MRRAIVAAALLIASTPFAVHAMDGHPVQATKMKWDAAPPGLPPGGQAALLFGNPAQSGLFVVRFKGPTGYKVLPHTHSGDESITVISGTLHVGHGPTFDTTKGEKLKAGDFITMPKGMQHYIWFSEPGEIQVHAMGPFDITYVNPGDDPRGTPAASTAKK